MTHEERPTVVLVREGLQTTFAQKAARFGAWFLITVFALLLLMLWLLYQLLLLAVEIATVLLSPWWYPVRESLANWTLVRDLVGEFLMMTQAVPITALCILGALLFYAKFLHAPVSGGLPRREDGEVDVRWWLAPIGLYLLLAFWASWFASSLLRITWEAIFGPEGRAAFFPWWFPVQMTREAWERMADASAINLSVTVVASLVGLGLGGWIAASLIRAVLQIRYFRDPVGRVRWKRAAMIIALASFLPLWFACGCATAAAYASEQLSPTEKPAQLETVAVVQDRSPVTATAQAEVEGSWVLVGILSFGCLSCTGIGLLLGRHLERKKVVTSNVRALVKAGK